MSAARTLRTVTRTLDREGIPYALIGAMALSAHGVLRMTHDADLLVADPRVLRDALWEGARRTVGVVVCPGDAEDPLLGVVRVGSAASRLPVDVVVPRGDWLVEVLARTHASGDTATLEGVAVPLVSLEDLLVLKVDAGGLIDMQDVALALEAYPESAPTLVAYVEAHLDRVSEHGRARWRRLMRDRGDSGS